MLISKSRVIDYQAKAAFNDDEKISQNESPLMFGNVPCKRCLLTVNQTVVIDLTQEIVFMRTQR